MPDDLTFQSTATATLPAGVKIATDDVGGVHYQRVKLDVGVDGESDPVLDLATEAAQTAGQVLLGAVAETAPATDTASSGLNGRLQRVAQRLTSLIAVLPAALGAGGGLKVDGSGTALPISGTVTVSSSEVTNAGTFVVQPKPAASGGLSIHRSIDLDEGTLEVVKGSAGCVYGMWVTNTAATTRWIKFYNATSGTYGTGTPVITIGIPGNVSDDISANFGPGGMGVQFSTGISVGAGTGVADNDTGAPAANDVIANIYFL